MNLSVQIINNGQYFVHYLHCGGYIMSIVYDFNGNLKNHFDDDEEVKLENVKA